MGIGPDLKLRKMNPNKKLVNRLTIRWGWSNDFSYRKKKLENYLPNKIGSKSFS
jgi:hypothetical protein